MVDQDELEKKLWHLRDFADGKIDFPHNHEVQWKGKTLIRPCPKEEQFGCFLDKEVMFQLGVSSRTIMQLDMGNIYNHVLGIIMACVYGYIPPTVAVSRIQSYLLKKAELFKELQK